MKSFFEFFLSDSKRISNEFDTFRDLLNFRVIGRDLTHISSIQYISSLDKISYFKFLPIRKLNILDIFSRNDEKIIQSKCRKYHYNIIAGFRDIFYQYLLYKNFNYSKDELYQFSLFHMAYGSQDLRSNLEFLIFNNLNVNDKVSGIQILEIIKKEFKLKTGNIAVTDSQCALVGKSKLFKNFYDTSWKFIDEFYLPKIKKKFEKNLSQYLSMYVETDINTKKQGRIALFHLGLLGKFERGEL